MSSAPVQRPADQPVREPGYDESPPAPSRRLEILLAVVALAFMTTAYGLAQGIELRREVGPGQIDARFWPGVLALTGVGLAVWRLMVAFVSPPDERDDQERVQRGGPRRVGSTVLAVVLFVAVWNQRTVTALGYRTELFPIITLLLLIGLVGLYGGRGVRALVLFPVLMTAGIYLLFDQLLGIPL